MPSTTTLRGGVVLPFGRRRPSAAAAPEPRDCAASRHAHLADLLARAGRGDADAFMRFYDDTSGAAYRLARAVCPDAAAAEELTRSLYVRAWTHAAQHAESGLSPVAWLVVPVLAHRPRLSVASAGRAAVEAAGG